MECIDYSKDVTKCELLDDNAKVLVLYDSLDVLKAKENKLQNWRNNEVYAKVGNEGQELFTVRWVVTEKLKDCKPVFKARLVARGFEENTSDMQKYSPTCSKGCTTIHQLEHIQSMETFSINLQRSSLKM